MKITKSKIKNLPVRQAGSKGGYAILELLFYIAFFALLSLAVINSLLVMTRAFKETTIHGQILRGGSVMERISREVRQSYGISLIAADSLALNTKDENGDNKTVEFLLTGSNVQLKENGVVTGNLNPPGLSVLGLTFTQINTPESAAVKIFLSVQSDNDSLDRIEDFYDTVVLRGDYQ